MWMFEPSATKQCPARQKTSCGRVNHRRLCCSLPFFGPHIWCIRWRGPRWRSQQHLWWQAASWWGQCPGRGLAPIAHPEGRPGALAHSKWHIILVLLELRFPEISSKQNQGSTVPKLCKATTYIASIQLCTGIYIYKIIHSYYIHIIWFVVQI